MYIHVLLKIFFYLFSSTEFQQFSELCILTNNIFIHKCIDASPLYLWVLNQFKLLHVFTLSIPISLRVNTELIYIHVYNYTCTCIYIYIYIFICTCTVEPLYCGQHWDKYKCPDYRGVLISEVNLYYKAQFGTFVSVLSTVKPLISGCPLLRTS